MVAYVVGSLFLSIFSFSCTAILHCFIMAEDANCNVETPPSLKSFLDKNDEMKKSKDDSKKETEMTDKKDDADAGDKPNDM